MSCSAERGSLGPVAWGESFQSPAAAPSNSLPQETSGPALPASPRCPPSVFSLGAITGAERARRSPRRRQDSSPSQRLPGLVAYQYPVTQPCPCACPGASESCPGPHYFARRPRTASPATHGGPPAITEAITRLIIMLRCS